MQPELKPVRTNESGFGRGSGSYDAAQDVAVGAPGQKVLRNTYMLLALTMVPTVAGAWIGIQFAAVMMASPIVTFGPLLNVALSMSNGVQLVGYAAAGTGVIFFAMGAVAQSIKRDLSFMGKFLFVGMIALLLAIVANIFLQIPALALTISTLVIVVFSLYLVYDLQRIIRGGETNYVMATTGVYISLLNIFSSLLHLLLALGGERD